MNKVVIIASVFLFAFAGNVFAAGLSEVEKAIFELEHIGMQVQSVENEMSLYLAQEHKDSPNYNKGASVKPAKKAVQDLNKIKSNLSALSLPSELNDLKTEFTQVIERLSDIYSAVSKKVKIDEEKEFTIFWAMVETYNNKLKTVIEKYLKIPQGFKDFNLVAHEAALFDAQDKEKFLKADDLIVKEKKYVEASAILNDLLPRYKNTPAEGIVISRLADCGEMGGDEIYKAQGDPEYVLKLLDDFILRKSYSPNIQKIFLQWRTLRQMYDNGLSNWSGIPNEKYISALWGVKEGIESYIAAHPEDEWAKIQLLLLMDTRIIERWRSDYQFGNSVAIDHYNLWGLENAP